MFIGVNAQARDTVGTEVLYYAEQKLEEPTSGLITYVPRGWVGVVPMKDVHFLLVPVNSTNAQIQITVYEMDGISELKEQLINGITTSDGEVIKAEEEVMMENGWIAANVSIKRAEEGASAYAEGTCGDNGYCVLNVLLAARDDLDALKLSMNRLSEKTTFEDEGMGNTK